MKQEIRDRLNFVGLPAGDAIAVCVSAISEMKNLKVSPADCHVIAERVISCVTHGQLDAYIANSKRDHCPVIEEANAELDRVAALHVVRLFAEVGNTPPPSDETVSGLADVILKTLPARKSGEPIYQWPGKALWEQLAASRFGVQTPAERAQFGFGALSNPGRA